MLSTNEFALLIENSVRYTVKAAADGNGARGAARRWQGSAACRRRISQEPVTFILEIEANGGGGYRGLCGWLVKFEVRANGKSTMVTSDGRCCY